MVQGSLQTANMSCLYFHLGVLFIGTMFLQIQGQSHPHSCADIYESNIMKASGTYTIYNRQNQPYQVYCEFHRGYGYTFVSPLTTVQVNIDDLHTDASHILVRDVRTDGSQYEAVISQIAKYQQRNLSIQYNAHTGYNGIQNSKMTPYLYIGLIPINGVSHKGDVQGYSVNGHDVTFVNCDGNPNSYFAFLFNQNHLTPTNYHNTDSSLLHQWVDRATVVQQGQHLPSTFFSFFEVHMGGCGAFGIPALFPHVTGAALGLRYDITCPMPEDIIHGTTASPGNHYGSTVTYTCDVGYTILKGDATRLCSETGKWIGMQPICGEFPCDSQPCQNGGLCFEVENSQYICECQDGFVGTLCETRQ